MSTIMTNGFRGIEIDNLMVSLDVIKHSKGREQQGLRPQAIVILGKKSGLEIKEIALIFEMSPSPVSVISKANKQMLSP